MWITVALVAVWCSTVRGQIDGFNQFGGKLTAERGGPPVGASFLPIAVVQFAPGRNTRPNRYRPGQPPPPPPPRPGPQPPRQPRPPVTPAAAVAPVTDTPVTAPSVSQDALPAYYHRFLQNDDLSYYFDFQSANKISRSEQGFFKQDGADLTPILVKTGMYSFTSPEGIPFRVDYVADEYGYRTFPSRP